MSKETLVHWRAKRHFGLSRQADELARQQVMGHIAIGGNQREDKATAVIEEHELYYETVKDGLVDIDSEIRRKKERKSEELPGLYEIKNTLVLLALQLRRDGEERIQVKMRDGVSILDRGYESGVIKISFLDDAPRGVHSTFANLSVLSSRFNDLPFLIGRPDGILLRKHRR